MATPTSLMVTIWSLRSVPISLLVLMFVFNSGSISTPKPNLHFWFDAIAVLGIVGIITAWNRLQRLRWEYQFSYLFIYFSNFNSPQSLWNFKCRHIRAIITS